MRLMHRNPENVALGILNGHNCLVSGTYKYSLGEYMSVFKQEPKNPMVALMLGLTFTHMACQKFSAKKHSLVVQVGFARCTRFISSSEDILLTCNSQLLILCNLNLLFIISRLQLHAYLLGLFLITIAYLVDNNNQTYFGQLSTSILHSVVVVDP